MAQLSSAKQGYRAKMMQDQESDEISIRNHHGKGGMPFSLIFPFRLEYTDLMAGA